MAFELTALAKLASEKTIKENQIIIEIDDCPLIFGVVDVVKIARIGDDNLFIGEFYIGGTIAQENSRPVINLSGSTRSIQQQIRQDQGGSSSVSNVKISLVDLKNEISTTLNNVTPDILSKDCDVYLGFKGLSHPENSIRIFSGNIESFETNAGLVNLSISNPEQKKRSELFTQGQTILTSAINNTTTTIPIVTADNFIIDIDCLKTYIKIDDELMLVTNWTQTTLTVLRAQLNTVANSHDIGVEVNSFYRLTENPIDLALKLMLSIPDNAYYKENVKFASCVSDDSETISNALFFNLPDVREKYGFIKGDFLSITGSVLGNNVTFAKILSWGKTSQSSYIVIDQNLVLEKSDTLKVAFKSQYNTLPNGCGLGAHQVDIDEHLRIKELYLQSVPTMDFYIKEGFEGKKFIEEQIYFPIGCYQIPRKGKASLGYTAPPLTSVETKTLSDSNVLNPDSIQINRSITKNFYNSIIYKFNQDVLEDKLLAGIVSVSETSNNKIKAGQKPLKIESTGFRNNIETQNFIINQSGKFLDRYQLGAESFTIKVTYGTGFNLEAGDIIIYDGKSLGSFDSKNNSRNFKKRLMQITNKSMDIQTGEVSLEITDTAFALNGRYATIGPSSNGLQESSTKIRLIQNQSSILDYEKWSNFIGENIRVRNSDFTFDQNAKLISIDEIDKYLITISAISLTSDDLIIELPEYSGNDETNETYKLQFGYANPRDQVVTATSTTFNTSRPELYFTGAIVFLHKDDFSIKTKEFEIKSISGNTITIDGDFGFTPDNTYYIDLIGFSDDNGKPYRIL